MIAAMERIIDTGGRDGVPVDYLDGVVFSADESYLCVGRRTTTPGPVSDYTGQHIYYRSIQHDGAGVEGVKEDRLTMHDYLWRWDTDWFWCSRAFGAQNPRLRRWWPRRYRRSSVYSKLVAMDQRFGIADRIETRNGRPPRERVVQDVEVPVERACEFLEWFLDNVPIDPIWLCPLRLRDRRRLAAVSDPAGPHLRQHRVLVIGAGRRHRGRDQPDDRGEGECARRAQVAVLRLLLHPRGV